MGRITRLSSVFLIASFIVVLGSELRASALAGNEWSPLDSLEGSQNVDPQIRAVATKFILTAVARRNTAASWKLLDPTFPGKSSFTKETWAKRAIPVIPFPARRSGIHLAVREVRSKRVLLEVLLTAGKRRPGFFELGLRDNGRDKRRWLVDYWMVKYVHSSPGFE